MVRKLNIDGDGQGDLEGHGGEQRAVFVYQMDAYHYWEKFLGRNDFSFGQFGENFTVEGLLDEEVFIGDRYRIGDALFRSESATRHLFPPGHSHERASHGGALVDTTGLAFIFVFCRKEKSPRETRL